MRHVVERMQATGGTIERWPGGFWTTPGTGFDEAGAYRVPHWYVGTNTVAALVARGYLVESKRQQTRSGSFAVGYSLAPQHGGAR
jgi:hypothetical protein